MKNNFFSYAFWVAVTGAIVIFLQNLGRVVGFDFNSTAFESIVLSFCGVLVVLGVLNKDKNEEGEDLPDSNNPKNNNEKSTDEKGENDEKIDETKKEEQNSNEKEGEKNKPDESDQDYEKD